MLPITIFQLLESEKKKFSETADVVRTITALRKLVWTGGTVPDEYMIGEGPVVNDKLARLDKGS